MECMWCRRQLPKYRRKYCCDNCAHEYFIHEIAPFWWNNAVAMAKKRAGHKCEDCGKEGYLEIHHKEKLDRFEARHNSPKNRQDNLRVLCRTCHEKAHHPHSDAVRNEEINKLQSVMF